MNQNAVFLCFGQADECPNCGGFTGPVTDHRGGDYGGSSDICRKHLNLTCHICGKVKSGTDFQRTLYELAFHYDRRHRGWTK